MRSNTDSSLMSLMIVLLAGLLAVGWIALSGMRSGGPGNAEPGSSPTPAPTIAAIQDPTTSPTLSANGTPAPGAAAPAAPPIAVDTHTPLPPASVTTPSPTVPPPIDSIYVDPVSGNDENSGSREDPLKTLQRALEMVEPGWYIKLRSGIYEQNMQTVTSGSPDSPIVIEPDGDAEPVLDGGLGLDAPMILNSFYVVRGIEMRNYDHGVELRGVEGVVLEENYIHHINGECVHIWHFAVKNVVKKNQIHDCGLKRNGEGIYIGTDSDQLYKVDGVVDESIGNLIEGNEIYSVDEGIDVKPGSSNTTIANNEIYSAINPGSGGINVRSSENYVANNLSYNNNGAGFRIGQSSGGVNNVLRGNIAINNDFGGYKFINGPQQGDCTNVGAGREEGRLYYFEEGLDKFLQCAEGSFSTERPWEAEDGEVLAPLKIVDDPSAGSGKHILQVDENGGGYAQYRVVVPRSGKYQFKARVKGEEGPPSSARISFDGNDSIPDSISWNLGGPHSDWIWVFGPTVQLSAGLHELRIHLDGMTAYVDKLELTSR